MSLKAAMERFVEKKRLHELEGDYLTQIPGVRFYRSAKGHPRKQTMYKSGIIVLGQGRKNLYAGGKRIPYGQGDCLVMGVPMPLECEAFRDEGKPLLGVGLEIPLPLLQTLVGKFEQHNRCIATTETPDDLSIRARPIDKRMAVACERLVLALCDDFEAEVLGPSLVEEVVFCALLGDCADTLFELARQEGRYARMSRVLEYINTHYAEALNVSELAASANMSVSAFHSAFRAITLESPIQYIKKVRLSKARELICYQGKRVSETAHMVGYSTAAQFSREFKRHFNETPKAAATGAM